MKKAIASLTWRMWGSGCTSPRFSSWLSKQPPALPPSPGSEAEDVVWGWHGFAMSWLSVPVEGQILLGLSLHVVSLLQAWGWGERVLHAVWVTKVLVCRCPPGRTRCYGHPCSDPAATIDTQPISFGLRPAAPQPHNPVRLQCEVLVDQCHVDDQEEPLLPTHDSKACLASGFSSAT